MTKRVMVVDAYNQFLRSYIVDPSLSTQGSPIGGSKGFLKILNKLTRTIKPDLTVVIWDGEGGSQRRRAMQKDYKAGRKPLRLNRDIRHLTEEEEAKNKVWQHMRVLEYLNQTPIIQFMESRVEADDIISYVVQKPELKTWQKVIVSSDKDFYQLLDDSTILVRPTQSEVLNKNLIVEKFGIHPNNFAIARALAGDKSDNISGLSGVGLKTVIKRFPFLSEAKEKYAEDLYAFSLGSEEYFYTKVVEEIDTIKHNYKMMQLYSPILSIQTKMRVDQTFAEYTPEFNKTEFMTLMHKDGIGQVSLSDLYLNFNKTKHDFSLSLF